MHGRRVGRADDWGRGPEAKNLLEGAGAESRKEGRSMKATDISLAAGGGVGRVAALLRDRHSLGDGIRGP